MYKIANLANSLRKYDSKKWILSSQMSQQSNPTKTLEHSPLILRAVIQANSSNIPEGKTKNSLIKMIKLLIHILIIYIIFKENDSWSYSTKVLQIHELNGTCIIMKDFISQDKAHNLVRIVIFIVAIVYVNLCRSPMLLGFISKSLVTVYTVSLLRWGYWFWYLLYDVDCDARRNALVETTSTCICQI